MYVPVFLCVYVCTCVCVCVSYNKFVTFVYWFLDLLLCWLMCLLVHLCFFCVMGFVNKYLHLYAFKGEYSWNESFRIKSNILSLTKKFCSLWFFSFYRPIFTYLSLFSFLFQTFYSFLYSYFYRESDWKKIVFPRQTSSFIWKYIFFLPSSVLSFVLSGFFFHFVSLWT